MASLQPPIHSYRRKQLGARLVNCFAEQSPISAKAPVRLIGAPGITFYDDFGDKFSNNDNIRGMLSTADYLYIVGNDTLYRVDVNDVREELGKIPGSGPVEITEERTYICILSDDVLRLWDGTTLTENTDPDFRNTSAMDSLDGYLLFIERGTDRFFSADLNDPTSIDALNFATAESSPDRLVGFIVDHGQIILAGEKTTEIWWNAGNAGFPFARIPNGVLETGCAAGKSLAKIDNSVFWLDDERIVRRLSDLTPVRVSQHGVEEAIASYSKVSDAEAFTYTFEGHLFYVLKFPTAGATWVYDVTTQEWHERETLGKTYWDVDYYAFFDNRHFVASGQLLGVMSADTYDEFGNEIRMEWTYQPIYGDSNRARHKEFEIVAKAGVGLESGASPAIGLSYSDDGGRTFTAMPNRSLGVQGAYEARARWHRLGASRDRVYRCFISDPVERLIQDTQVEVDGGRF